MSHANYYKALVSHDERFDGTFFVGVSSTHIYCRPVCRVRTPQEKNCTFFSNAAAAEYAGFRPCLKCRPELAPGILNTNNSAALLAATYIDKGFLQDKTFTDLAKTFSLSERHLRRIFQNYWGVSLVYYSQTQKLLLAKQLLTESQLSITTIAFSAGFSSLSRFNELFKQRYHLSPSQLRKRNKENEKKEIIQLVITYRKPFAWEELLSFLAKRAIPGVELVANGTYSRSVSLTRNNKIYKGWITVVNDKKIGKLIVKMPDSLAPVTALVLAKTKQLFDTNCSPDIVAKQLGKIANSPKGLRVPGTFDGFELSVRAILGQQITVAGASTLAGRLVNKVGENVETPFKTIIKTFPTPLQIINAGRENLANLGITKKRIETILILANAINDKQISFEQQTTIATAIEQLISLKGIGKWTAIYIAMRALQWPDAFLESDYGIKKVLNEKDEKVILKIAEQWQPWRSYAMMYLWNSLERREVKI